MRPQALLILSISLLVAADGTDDPVKKEQDRFQGKWALHSAKRDGKPMADEEVKKITLTIEGDRYVLRKESAVISEGTFVVDPAKTPKEIDELATAGPSKGKRFLAIYEIDDEQHKICFAAPGKDRPTDFSSTPGSGRLLQVWKRIKK